IDKRGIIKLTLASAEAVVTDVGSIFRILPALLDKKSSYSDAGLLAPDVFVVVGARLIDLSSLISVNQIITILRTELQETPGTETVIVIIMEKHF
ncbi:MAG: hypothetical protein ACP5US_12180, partial [Candidatus Kryptoniota bacterium]